MININPKMPPRLDEMEADLLARRARAKAERWLGEIEGIDLTLTFLRQKRDETRRLAKVAPLNLGMQACPPHDHPPPSRPPFTASAKKPHGWSRMRPVSLGLPTTRGDDHG
jgi:hypothetical protein